MRPTESQILTNTKLKRIAWLSSRSPDKEFACLMHLFNEESLKSCYDELKGNKAVGADGIDKACYGKELGSNIQQLVTRMRQMSYRPQPVLQKLIPKDGKRDAKRQLGISCFEDKIVQKMMHKVLESIYEPLFLECSYGFRPGRGCHDAIRALRDYLYRYQVETVIEVDIANYFDT
jgi:retron-type reverse transcriptase